MKNLFEFIKAAITPYHTVEEIKKILIASGYTELSEKSDDFSDGGSHFVIKDGSAIIAFRGEEKDAGFVITASHNDTPTFKVKCSENGGSYAKLAVERYGGMIMPSWLDRPLSVAGRVTLRTPLGISTRLVNLDKNVCSIPNVAIHFNRSVNDGYKYNPAVDMLPLFSLSPDTDLTVLIAKTLDVRKEDILTSDLYLYNRDEPTQFGAHDELILSPRLDDIACVYTSLTAFLNAKDSGSVSVLAVFNNEEVGSDTKQGANSTFLDDTLYKIAGSREKYNSMLADSFMVSADNAHAKHPNHPELSDRSAPILGGGVVIKHNANQKYTTDAVSDAVFRVICERSSVAVQDFYNRADIVGGSTLGSISDTKVSIPTVDIGIAQLAMHSAVECAALSDFDAMIAALTELYSSTLSFDAGEIKITK